MLTKEEIKARQLAAIVKEAETNERRTVWMSFCDTDKPEGHQFLGVIIVQELGPAHAVQKTHELGINPGGQIAFEQAVLGAVDEEHLNRLLSRADLVEFGYIDAEERSK